MIKNALPLLLISFSLIKSNAQVPQLYGMAGNGSPISYGASFSIGEIFKINGDGSNFDTVHAFKPIVPGRTPEGKVVQASDGWIYGMTEGGGVNGDAGGIYKYDPKTFKYKFLYEFNFFNDIDGGFPLGGLIEAKDGNLYGMARGGAYSGGVIFQFDPKSTSYKKLHDFDGTNGYWPNSDLYEANDGNLYGMTSDGGEYNKGVIFSFNAKNKVFKKLYDFNGLSGEYPRGSLIQSSNGKLYGTTGYGGIYDCGVLFSYSLDSNTYTVLCNFKGSLKLPVSSLLQAQDSLLYGVTSDAGGALFSYNIVTSSLETLYFFHYTHNYPLAGVIRAKNGLLYGTTIGFAISRGSIYSYNPQTKKLVFIKQFEPHDVSGGEPEASLFEAKNGNLYGTTYGGGNYHIGVLFQLNPETNKYRRLINFGRSEGSRPASNLIVNTDGLLYGITPWGGLVNHGVLFSVDPKNKNYKVYYEFHHKENGSRPVASLFRAADGMLYGTTEYGGNNLDGTIFKYDPNSGTYKKLYDFTDFIQGHPKSSMIQASNGLLYATSGSKYSSGIIYSFDPVKNLFSIEANFSSCGASISDYSPYDYVIYPQGHPVQGSDGLLYGITIRGGKNNGGVIYGFNTQTHEIKNLFDFSIYSGSSPRGSLLQLSDGKLYGMTRAGGHKDGGVIFSYDPVNGDYNDLFDFDNLTGSYPDGSLIQASNGILYGMTSSGGSFGFGTIFSFDPNTQAFTKLKDLEITNRSPTGDLVEIVQHAAQKNDAVLEALNCTIFSSENIIHIRMSLPTVASDITLIVLNSSGQVIFDEDEGMQANFFERDIALRRSITAGIYSVIAKYGQKQFTKQVFLSGSE